MTIGNIASDGVTVTLTQGQVPSWMTAGAQVCGSISGSTTYGKTVFVNVPGTNPFFPSPYDGVVPTTSLPAIASITSPTSFTLTTLSGGGKFTDGTSLSGVRFYLGQPWTAAMTKGVWQNVSGTLPPTSFSTTLSSGFFGADGGFSVNGPSSSMWFYADTDWATTSGAYGRVGVSGSSRLDFLNNSIAIQTWSGTSPNLSIDNMSFVVQNYNSVDKNALGTYPPNSFMWPNGGLWRADGSLLLFGEKQSYTNSYFSTFICLRITNPTDPINSWNIQVIPIPFGIQAGGLTSSPVKEGSYYYMVGASFSYSPDELNRNLLITRFPVADIEATIPVFTNAEWWCGNIYGWVSGNFYDPDFSVTTQSQPIVTGSKSTLVMADSKCSLYQNWDGNYIIVQGGTFTNPCGVRALNLGNSLANLTLSGNLTLGNFGDLVYSPPSDVGISAGNNLWFYSCRIHPQQTFSGQANGEYVVTYATNTFGGTGPSPDSANYWVQTLRIAGF